MCWQACVMKWLISWKTKNKTLPIQKYVYRYISSHCPTDFNLYCATTCFERMYSSGEFFPGSWLGNLCMKSLFSILPLFLIFAYFLHETTCRSHLWINLDCFMWWLYSWGILLNIFFLHNNNIPHFFLNPSMQMKYGV